jgi:hypothetical protein
VCGHSFNAQSAAVACLELYESEKVVSFTTGAVKCDQSGFWLDEVACTGNEHEIDDCPHSPYGKDACDASKDCILLFCEAGGPKPSLPVQNAVL